MTQYSRVPLRGNPFRGGPALPGWLLGVLLGVFVLATVVSAYLVFATVRDFVAGLKISAANPTAPTSQGDGAAGGGAQPVDGQAVPTVALRPWTGLERVTVLVMGIDRRQGEQEKGYLTDTMMLVTLDPAAKTGGMLSIPRDLWVEIPGYGVDTINTANRTGDYYDYPGGGPALAVKTVEYNLGVTVHYYLRLDFTAFETLVDTIGGIDLHVDEEINDPYYPDGAYGYEPFYLAAGQQHLGGHDALRYARTRHDSSDIDRANRQQQVVMAARDKVLSLHMLPTLVVKAPVLYRTLNESFWTDLSLEQMVSLALLAQDIPRENIQSAVIDYRYVLDYQTPEGRQVLVPLRDKIRELRDSMFASSIVMAAATAQNDKSLLAAEAARVEVLNGAGVQDLACNTSQWLKGQGINVVACDTADRSDYASSVIVDYSGKPYTTRWLATTFRVTTIISGADPSSPVDVRIILGQNWSVPTGSALP